MPNQPQKIDNCILYLNKSPSITTSSIETMEKCDTESIYSVTSTGLDKRSKQSGVDFRPNGLSSIATLINFLKGMIGPACLSLPLALRQSGLVAGVILIFIFGFLNTYCMLQLVQSSQKLSRNKGRVLDYGEVAYEACANSFQCLRKYRNVFKHMCTSSIIMLQFGVCAVCYVFMSEHVKQIMSEQFSLDYSPTAWSLVIFGPLFIVNLLQTLKIMASLSFVGNLCMIGTVVFILQFLIRQPHQIVDLPYVTDVEGFMVACCSILYSYEGQALVLPMENKIREPKRMLGTFGVLSQGMFTCTLIYACCGFFGYATYGNEVQGSIALNFPGTISMTIIKALLVFVIFSGFSIQQYVIVNMTWPTLSRKLGLDKTANKWARLCTESTYRTCLLIGELLVAILIPSLEKIIPLIGSTVGMLLALCFPALIDTMTFGPVWLKEGGRLKFGLCLTKNLFFISVGLMCMVAGVRANVMNFVKT